MDKYIFHQKNDKFPPFLKGGRDIYISRACSTSNTKFKQLFSFYAGILLVLLLLCSCGKSPSNMPNPALGSISVTAMLDTAAADSAEISLDGYTFGVQAVPFKIDNLYAGRHLVSVSLEDKSSIIDYSSKPEKVLVEKNKTAEIILPLTKYAPGFSLNNINDEIINLEDFQNRVVFLIFFSNM